LKLRQKTPVCIVFIGFFSQNILGSLCTFCFRGCNQRNKPYTKTLATSTNEKNCTKKEKATAQNAHLVFAYTQIQRSKNQKSIFFAHARAKQKNYLSKQTEKLKLD